MRAAPLMIESHTAPNVSATHLAAAPMFASASSVALWMAREFAPQYRIRNEIRVANA